MAYWLTRGCFGVGQGKKLRGKRKRKEEARQQAAPQGGDFEVDVRDARFDKVRQTSRVMSIIIIIITITACVLSDVAPVC
jgi:hypothetical protein